MTSVGDYSSSSAVTAEVVTRVTSDRNEIEISADGVCP